jgi:hypothetical protein
LAAAILGGELRRGDRVRVTGDAEGLRFEPFEGSVEAAE